MNDDGLLPILALGAVGAATGGFGLAGAGAASAGAATYVNPFTGAAFGVSAPSAFSAFSTAELLSAGSLASGLLGSYQQNALQQESFDLQAAQTRAQNAESARDTERELIRTLAQINNAAGNQGQWVTSGTVQGAIQSARAVTSRQLASIGITNSAQLADLQIRRKQATSKAGGSGVGSLFDYGLRKSRNRYGV